MSVVAWPQPAPWAPIQSLTHSSPGRWGRQNEWQRQEKYVSWDKESLISRKKKKKQTPKNPSESKTSEKKTQTKKNPKWCQGQSLTTSHQQTDAQALSEKRLPWKNYPPPPPPPP